MRGIFLGVSFLVIALIAGVGHFVWTPFFILYVVFLPLFLIGIADMVQTRQTIRRNFPLIGHFRYLLEEIRPEIQQYFIERNDDGRPFSRELRSIIYQRAKRTLDTLPFGTQLDLYQIGYEWINHSIVPAPLLKEEPRVEIGKKNCSKPYSASRLNISGMSYGALSDRSILSLNKGAKMGGFAHNTGEGSISPYHLKYGGDLIWQIGTGYFGCRKKDGTFCKDTYKERASQESVKMIELKISQGAKPGHGGILPGRKVTKEIAKIRDVPMGEDVISPPAHSAFSTPIEMMEYISMLRELSGGKPVGVKMCLGKRRDFLAICKAMVATQITPDFVVVDGAEGGTGAAPLEFSNSIGHPLIDALTYVHNALVGIDVRKDVKLGVSGKVATGFHMAQKLALGADFCMSARAMMFALGCIQALRCNANNCPTGVATNRPELVRGIVVDDKAKRVANYHAETIESFLEVISAAGVKHPDELKPWMIMRRVDQVGVKPYTAIYEYLEPGDLLGSTVPPTYKFAWENSSEKAFY